jgi:hypothetical protein
LRARLRWCNYLVKEVAMDDRTFERAIRVLEYMQELSAIERIKAVDRGDMPAAEEHERDYYAAKSASQYLKGQRGDARD